MIDPVSGTGLILSLIQIFHRERDKTKQANTEELFKWLLEHKFSEIKDSISQNKILTGEIENLLRSNRDELIERFNKLEEMVGVVASGFSDFRKIVSAINPSAELSAQALSIINQFVDSGGRLILTIRHLNGMIIQTDNRVAIKVAEFRFLDDDLSTLCNVGLLSFDGYMDSGGERYRITRNAVKFVESIKVNV